MRKVPIECLDCEYRLSVKSKNHAVARYKSMFKEKQFRCDKMKALLRSHNLHLKKIQKKIEWMSNETKNALRTT